MLDTPMHVTSNWDNWDYLWTLVAFAVGWLAGFQAVYLRFPTNPRSAALSIPGSIYLVTRGAIPALIFFFLRFRGWIPMYAPLLALAAGTGWETVLRSQFLLKQTTREGGGIDELVKGPLDLLRWYQDIFLGQISTKAARRSLNFVKSHLPTGDFQALCTIIRRNTGAFQQPIAGLEEGIAKLESEFLSDMESGKQETYRLKLGFIVLHKAGEENFKTLFS
ncbi:MAG TPA: hypothetical protein VKT33_10030 [Candidatus Angelobacter sp.]|nr:hypothetical protein [Candidatus Angelobacter sp.]